MNDSRNSPLEVKTLFLGVRFTDTTNLTALTRAGIEILASTGLTLELFTAAVFVPPLVRLMDSSRRILVLNHCEQNNYTSFIMLDSYIASLYWTFATLSTLGYGDFIGSTTSEYIYTMFVEVSVLLRQ